MYWICWKNNVRIINCSRGWNTYSFALQAAISNYSGLLVCAAGNSGVDNDSNPLYPASYDLPNIISVGALKSENNIIKIMDGLDSNGNLVRSNYGATSVDLFAPGQNIVSTYKDGGYDIDSGTSFAAPFVTGVAAMILSIVPDLSIRELKITILENVTSMTILSNKCVTGGMLNAEAAVKNIHRHNFIYLYDSGEYHRGECSCGDIDIQPHTRRRNPSGGMICTKCGGTSLLVNCIKKEEEEY